MLSGPVGESDEEKPYLALATFCDLNFTLIIFRSQLFAVCQPRTALTARRRRRRRSGRGSGHRTGGRGRSSAPPRSGRGWWPRRRWWWCWRGCRRRAPASSRQYPGTGGGNTRSLALWSPACRTSSIAAETIHNLLFCHVLNVPMDGYRECVRPVC